MEARCGASLRNGEFALSYKLQLNICDAPFSSARACGPRETLFFLFSFSLGMAPRVWPHTDDIRAANCTEHLLLFYEPGTGHALA